VEGWRALVAGGWTLAAREEWDDLSLASKSLLACRKLTLVFISLARSLNWRATDSIGMKAITHYCSCTEEPSPKHRLGKQ